MRPQRIRLIQEIVTEDVDVIEVDLDRIPVVSQGMPIRQAIISRCADSSFHSFWLIFVRNGLKVMVFCVVGGLKGAETPFQPMLGLCLSHQLENFIERS